MIEKSSNEQQGSYKNKGNPSASVLFLFSFLHQRKIYRDFDGFSDRLPEELRDLDVMVFKAHFEFRMQQQSIALDLGRTCDVNLARHTVYIQLSSCPHSLFTWFVCLKSCQRACKHGLRKLFRFHVPFIEVLFHE